MRRITISLYDDTVPDYVIAAGYGYQRHGQDWCAALGEATANFLRHAEGSTGDVIDLDAERAKRRRLLTTRLENPPVA